MCGNYQLWAKEGGILFKKTNLFFFKHFILDVFMFFTQDASISSISLSDGIHKHKSIFKHAEWQQKEAS